MQYSKKIYFMALLLCTACTVVAQKAERESIRKGNRSYKNKSYVEAEVNYRKALETNSFSTEALYNLGNALLLQGKDKEALGLYEKAAQRCTNPGKLSMIYHNIGDVYMASANYAAAIEAFKQSLRKDPTNDFTRYNLALAQKLLKKNPPQDQDQQKQQQKKNDQQKQEENKNKNEKKNPKQQEQKKDQMSKENAEQLLKAAMQDEQRLREQMKKEAPAHGNQLEKDW